METTVADPWEGQGDNYLSRVQIIDKDQFELIQEKYKTDAAIGRAYGVSRQYIFQLRRKFGLKSSRLNNYSRNDEILHLLNSGKSRVEISKMMGLSYTQVCRISKNW
jgi:uncharacterized cupin superfamily protein